MNTAIPVSLQPLDFLLRFEVVGTGTQTKYPFNFAFGTKALSASSLSPFAPCADPKYYQLP